MRPWPLAGALFVLSTAAVASPPPRKSELIETAAAGALTTPAQIAQSNEGSGLFRTPGLSPLERPEGRSVGLLTAAHLRTGEWVETRNGRIFSPQPSVSTFTSDDVNLNLANSYAVGITDSFELGLDLQGQNTTTPGTLNAFGVRRSREDGTGPNVFQEYTLYGKLRLFEAGALRSSVVLSGTYTDQRLFAFFPADGSPPFSVNLAGLIPALEVPVTFTQGDFSFTISPRVAFFAQDNAVWFPINPRLGGRFGPSFGVGFGLGLRLGQRLLLRADATPILSGANTIDVASGLPGRQLVFNAGLRYLVNPRLALDLYATNAIGNSGAASFAARPDLGIGASLSFLPDSALFSLVNLTANREFAAAYTPRPRRDFILQGGLGFLDGGTVPRGVNFVQGRAGSRALALSVRSGVLDDFEAGFFADFNTGNIDESDAGFTTKIRFFDQSDGDWLTVSGALALGRTSARLFNLLSGRPDGIADAPDQFNAGVGDRGPLPANLFATERAGEQLVAAVAVPFERVEASLGWWVTPKFVYIQRAPAAIAPLVAVTFGGAIQLGPTLELVGEASPVLAGSNALTATGSVRRLPWSLGLRWRFASVFDALARLPNATSLELYLTNTLGFSPFQSLRVNYDNGLAFGLGLNFPVRF